MPQLWLPLAYLVVTLLLIDATESLATIAAVDNIDPYRRRSDPDQTLLAMGVSNGASSMLGGLTIIPGMVKSTANVMAGGRTQWANFYNACFLLTFVLLGRYVIDMVPMAVLAAILVFIGYKLCKPALWLKVARIGTEQFVVFVTTLLVTVTTDLLIGIVAGVALELLLNLWYVGLWHTLSNGSEFARPNFAGTLPQSLPQSGVRAGSRRRHVPPVPGWSPGVFQPVPRDSGAGAASGRHPGGVSPLELPCAARRSHDRRIPPLLPGRVQRPGPESETGDRRMGPHAIPVQT